MFPPKEMLELARSRILELVGEEKKGGLKVVYVKRDEKNGSRFVRGDLEEKMREKCSELGVEFIVHDGTESVKDQMKLFSEADVVIGPHGAGLFSFVFLFFSFLFFSFLFFSFSFLFFSFLFFSFLFFSFLFFSFLFFSFLFFSFLFFSFLSFFSFLFFFFSFLFFLSLFSPSHSFSYSFFSFFSLGMANILFSKPGTSVRLFPMVPRTDDFVRYLSAALDLNFQEVFFFFFFFFFPFFSSIIFRSC